jgi:arylsulfatase A-like enzyme
MAARVARLALASLALFACGEPPPSVLLVTLDTLRRDHVSAYPGARIRTPHLEALANEGLVHDAAYTTMPTTGPAHLSLFTGLYPSQHRGRRNGETLPPTFTQRELGVKLRRFGYATAAFVTTSLIDQAATGLRGFEVYDEPQAILRHGENAVDAALAWLDAERQRPVFLWVHIYDPHSPYGNADEKRLSFPVDPARYGWVKASRYASQAERSAMAERYARGVRSADDALGRLVEGVRERLARAPLVIVVADHGELLDEHLDDRGFAFDHGEFLDEESVAIPLVLAGPGVTPGRSAGTASIRDLYTTILATSGLGDPDAAAEGRRDLRVPSDAPRIVRIERRFFLLKVPELVNAQAAAAADGEQLVIVGNDGHSPVEGQADAQELLREARRSLSELGSERTLRPIDPETRKALKQLGYAE